MGHAGLFIDDDFLKILSLTGFAIESDELIKYLWKFDTVDAMVEYCILMFGLDKATPEQVQQGIEAYQGFSNNGSGCDMNWELRFIRCRK